MLYYRAIIISPSLPLRGRRTDGGTLEVAELFSCSHKGVRRCLPGPSVGWLPSTENGGAWRWKIVTREVVGLCCSEECVLGTTVWEGLSQIPTHLCHTRHKMSNSCCLQPETERNSSAVFSNVWVNLCLCLTQRFLNFFCIWWGGEGVGRVRGGFVLAVTDLQGSNKYFRFEVDQLWFLILYGFTIVIWLSMIL